MKVLQALRFIVVRRNNKQVCINEGLIIWGLKLSLNSVPNSSTPHFTIHYSQKLVISHKTAEGTNTRLGVNESVPFLLF